MKTTSPMSCSPIFIVGPPRSGTTLLKNILNNHPEVWILHETHFFEEVYPLRNEKDPANPSDLNDIVSRIMEGQRRNLEHDENSLPFRKTDLVEHFRNNPPESFQDIFSGLLDVVRRKEQVSIPGDKTPRHLFHVDSLLEWYPDAEILTMLRDGRDFLASYKLYGQRESVSREERKRVSSLYHPITTSLYWRSCARALLYWKDHDSVHPIRFEQLVTAPEETIRDVLNQIGLEFHPGMLEVGASNTSFEEDEEQHISDAPVGRWSNRLSSGELFWFEWINQNTMEQLNYTLEEGNGSLAGLPHLFSFPWQVTRALWMNRHRTDNLLSYVWKRLRPGSEESQK